jgi:hypothetical protein
VAIIDVGHLETTKIESTARPLTTLTGRGVFQALFAGIDWPNDEFTAAPCYIPPGTLNSPDPGRRIAGWAIWNPEIDQIESFFIDLEDGTCWVTGQTSSTADDPPTWSRPMRPALQMPCPSPISGQNLFEVLFEPEPGLQTAGRVGAGFWIVPGTSGAPAGTVGYFGWASYDPDDPVLQLLAVGLDSSSWTAQARNTDTGAPAWVPASADPGSVTIRHDNMFTSIAQRDEWYEDNPDLLVAGANCAMTLYDQQAGRADLRIQTFDGTAWQTRDGVWGIQFHKLGAAPQPVERLGDQYEDLSGQVQALAAGSQTLHMATEPTEQQIALMGYRGQLLREGAGFTRDGTTLQMDLDTPPTVDGAWGCWVVVSGRDDHLGPNPVIVDLGGQADGQTQTFTIPATPPTTTITLVLNGQVYPEGAGWVVNRATGQVTTRFDRPPQEGDELWLLETDLDPADGLWEAPEVIDLTGQADGTVTEFDLGKNMAQGTVVFLVFRGQVLREKHGFAFDGSYRVRAELDSPPTGELFAVCHEPLIL